MNVIEKAKRQLQNNLPFVLFAKPNENQLNAYFQQDDEMHSFLDQAGFVFVSFDGEKRVVIPEENKHYETEEINSDLGFHVSTIDISTSKEERNQFENLVNTAVNEIQNGRFEKLVVSRKIDFSTEIDVFETYKNLLKTYKTAFRYMFFHPKAGFWLGATPEQLIKIHGNQFETVALAGTQLYAKNVTWTSKEIQEQQYVTDYIVSNCNELAKNVKVSQPFTVQAGKLAHIKTVINGSIENTKVPELLKKLHPTPAVCGLPKERAKEFILKNEDYERKFYAGYLGEWNVNETSNLFVNLRCMEIGKMNSIYVGCGITASSEAEKEYNETQNKSETIKNIISTRK